MRDDNDRDELAILEAMAERPGLYWGDSANHFHSFKAFLSGYDIARSDQLNNGTRSQLNNLVPPDFSKFVTEHFGQQYPYEGWGWASFIERNSASGAEAMALFLKLRRLYAEVHRVA